MSLQLILLQLSEGMLSTIWIFVLTLLFFPSFGACDRVWTDVTQCHPAQYYKDTTYRSCEGHR